MSKPSAPSAEVLARSLTLHAREKAAASTMREEHRESSRVGYLEAELEAAFEVILQAKTQAAEHYLQIIEARLGLAPA